MLTAVGESISAYTESVTTALRQRMADLAFKNLDDVRLEAKAAEGIILEFATRTTSKTSIYMAVRN